MSTPYEMLQELRGIFGDGFLSHRTSLHEDSIRDKEKTPSYSKSNFAEDMMDVRKGFPGWINEKEGEQKRPYKKGGQVHYPFKRSARLGPGPRGRKHKENVCWRCTCGDIYDDGCRCVGTGASDSCPRGKVKKIKIKQDYRSRYNKEYHAWRAKQGAEIAKRLGGVRTAHAHR